MKEAVDARILWLARVLCMPRWRAAARMVSDRAKRVAGFDAVELMQNAGTVPIADRNQKLFNFAERVRSDDPVLALAFELLALCTDDAAVVIHAAVAGAVALLSSADGDTSQARARLRVWDDTARGKYTTADDGDLFEIADMYWRGEMQFLVPGEKGEVRITSGVPACLELLWQERWDEAFAWLEKRTRREIRRLCVSWPESMSSPDRHVRRAAIQQFVGMLFEQGRDWCGELALAWQMMLCDPGKPESFNLVLPQMQWMIEHWAIITNPEEKRRLQDRLDVWWLAARGEWADAIKPFSIFRIASVEIAERAMDGDMDPPPPVEPAAAEPAMPSVVVMPKALADERNMPMAWREMRDQALPLVVAHCVARIRYELQNEFPHAHQAIALLMQNVREGEPVRMRPTILLGPAGRSKSRLVRRIGEALGLYVYRYDGAAAHDATYAGSPKSWSSAQPSAPARAIMMSRTANPIALVDELEKGATSVYNGNLWNSMMPFLERETSARYREAGLDAELDLSHVVHIATANSIEPLPGPLRDRYRIIRVPAPTLAHLPMLAASVMRDLAAEDESRRHDEPIANDELEVIGRAWKRERFSVRKLRRLISATLGARDAMAPRH